MTQPFSTPLDIGNRALDHCGVTPITSFTQNSKSAALIARVYPKLRVAELRRNVWRHAIRTVALRPIDLNTLLINPPAFDAAKTYVAGSLITSDEVIYFASQAVPVAQTPADSPTYWTQYFGPLTVSPWDSTDRYFAGELVYTPSTTSAVVYLSLITGNEDDPTTVDAWDATVTYGVGDTVTAADAVVYQSRVNLNINLNPTAAGHPTQWETIPVTQPQRRQSINWIRVSGATLTRPLIIYPLGTGPQSQRTTRNIFRLPAGFLREAPQDPKAGIVAYLGAPTGLPLNDWEYDGDYLCASEPSMLVYRFVADVTNVRGFDPMFCEGLAARIALEVCEPLTQSTEKLQNIGAEYKTFMGDARTVNGIETGAVQPPEDEYITCRG